MKQENGHIEKPFKLEEMPKKQIYTVPDGYFDQLPQVIQSRAVKPQTGRSIQLNWSLAMRFALPVLALVLMVTYFGIRINNHDINVQAMLDDIPTEELAAYIAESDISTEEILSMVDLANLDVDEMIDENIQLLDDNEWDQILDDYPDIENDI